MATYEQLLKQHLTNYKTQRLGVDELGTWRRNNRPYSHILPISLARLNIIETYRLEFWDFFKSLGTIKLHPDFAHLNSSQGMGFNLFFPFIVGGNLSLLPELLGAPNQAIQHARFERVLDPVEKTNFDLCVELQSGARILVELKLSENSFGTAPDDANRRQKLATIYEPLLRGVVNSQVLASPQFFKRYQLLRNISYLGRDTSSILVLIFPSQNMALSTEVKKLWPALDASLTSRIRIITLDALVGAAQQLASSQPASPATSLLQAHFELFCEKYLI